MKDAPLLRDLMEITVFVRLAIVLVALGTLAAAIPWMRSGLNGALLGYQSIGLMLSLAAFALTFEQHFSDYWQIEAALFLGVSLLIWGGIGIIVADPQPLRALTLAIPIITVLLPLNWEVRLGLCALCVGSAFFEARIGANVTGSQFIWMTVAAESLVAVLASIQLERRRRQEDVYFRALVADEEQFRALIENAPDGLTVINGVGSIVFQNPSAKRLFGTEELTGRSVFEFLHQDDAPEFRRIINQCMDSAERSPEMTLRFRRANSTWGTIAGMARQLPNYDETPLVVLNWRDITARALEETRIHQSEEKFRKIFQYSTNAISLVSRSDGRYLDVNEEWLKLFGYTRSEIIGKDLLELGRWADSNEYLRFAAELLAKGEIRNRVAVLRAKNGSMVRALISSVIIETTGTSLVLSLISTPAVISSAPEVSN